MGSEDGATEQSLQALLDGPCEQTRVEAPGPGTHQILVQQNQACSHPWLSDFQCCVQLLRKILTDGSFFPSQSFYILFYSFICFRLCWGFIAARGLSTHCGGWGLLELQRPGFSWPWLLLFAGHGSH